MRLHTHIMMGIELHERFNDHIPHRKAFLLGNILPDILINFRMVSHNLPVSMEYVKKRIALIDKNSKPSMLKSLRLGIINHFLTDSCCVPHKDSFFGGFFKHWGHEIRLNKIAKCFFEDTTIRSKHIYKELNDALIIGHNILLELLIDDKVPSLGIAD